MMPEQRRFSALERYAHNKSHQAQASRLRLHGFDFKFGVNYVAN